MSFPKGPVVLALVSLSFGSRLVVAQTLEVLPRKIEAGRAATLRWDVGGARAFLVGYGEVSGKGSAVLKPDSTTDFILISESATASSGYAYSTQQLIVTGGRGGDEGFPHLSDFEDAIRGSSKSTDYLNFQANTWSLLQTKGYRLRGEFAPARPYVAIYTDFALRPDLVSRNERVRARRLALAVEIDQPKKKGDLVAFGVRPRLEFQYVGGTEWRWDKQNAIATAEAVKVMQALQETK
jgi:hypothetical protein